MRKNMNHQAQTAARDSSTGGAAMRLPWGVPPATSSGEQHLNCPVAQARVRAREEKLADDAGKTAGSSISSFSGSQPCTPVFHSSLTGQAVHKLSYIWIRASRPLGKPHAAVPLAEPLQRPAVAPSPGPVSPGVAGVAAAVSMAVVIIVACHPGTHVLEGVLPIVQKAAAAAAAAAAALACRRLLLLLRLEDVPAALAQVIGCAGIPASRALIPAVG